MLQATLVFLIQKDTEGKIENVLLGQKRSDVGKIGEKKWNGIGGKFEIVKGDKTMKGCAVREVGEEIDVEILESNLTQVGKFVFTYLAKPEWNQTVFVYFVAEWEGVPVYTEAEKIFPQWWEVSTLPFDLMWEDDSYWLPRVINGELLEGSFIFDEKNELSSHTLNSVEGFEI